MKSSNKRQQTKMSGGNKEKTFSTVREMSAFFFPEGENGSAKKKGDQRGTEEADCVFREITREAGV
jgi:hypothetical protein